MKYSVIEATSRAEWQDALCHFAALDVCHSAAYHAAYATRFAGAKALLFTANDGENHFAYPFLYAPVMLGEEQTDYYDISGIYGYSGPLSTTRDDAFNQAAWAEFDKWAADQHILCEFIRYSPYLKNEWLKPAGATVLENRQVAICEPPTSQDVLLQALGSKTRNMLRKAEKADLTAREMDVESELPAFRALYDVTMQRNQAPEFFLYDEVYYNHLLSLPASALRLFGVYAKEQLVSTAMVLVEGKNALYHLGASEGEYTKLGAGNLALFAMHNALADAGVEFVNLTGGRTTASDDPLLRFKKSNGTGLAPFYIGKRVLDAEGYASIVKRWTALYGAKPDTQKLQFYR